MSLAHERTSEFFEKRRRERRNIATPEGIPIPVILADYGERVTAFFLDWLLWFVLLVCDDREPGYSAGGQRSPGTESLCANARPLQRRRFVRSTV